MEYVFQCFSEREDACLLWRPHPMLESTIDSMRAEFRPFYDALKRCFVEGELGILDTTSDITDTILLCDAYVGDANSSITALFGIAGKPLFILNNQIHSKPVKEDWRGEIITGFNAREDDRWRITQGNKLYYAEKNDYHYKFYCDLSEYAYGSYYTNALMINHKVYVCPFAAQNILIVGKEGIEDKIELQRETEKGTAFYTALKWENYILLVPFNYPALVRVNTETGEVSYFRDHLDVFVKTVQGTKKVGGPCVHHGHLLIPSPTDYFVYDLQIESGKERVVTVGSETQGGVASSWPYKDDIWLLPRKGKTIIKWNPETEEIREYSDLPIDFACSHPIYNYSCEGIPFSGVAVVNDSVYFSPYWGNMYIELDIETGIIDRWMPPFEIVKHDEYFNTGIKSCFIRRDQNASEKNYLLFSALDRKLYSIDMESGKYKEIPIDFDINELKEHEPGFSKNDEWLQYCCRENYFNSLSRFLSDDIIGGQFDKRIQIEANKEIIVNADGRCGEKVHKYIMNQL